MTQKTRAALAAEVIVPPKIAASDIADIVDSVRTVLDDTINTMVPSQSGAGGKVLTSNGTVVSWQTPPPGAAIGSPVSGGTPNDILFIDGSGNLAQDTNLTWNGNEVKVKVDSTNSTGLHFVRREDGGELLKIGRTNGIQPLMDTGGNPLNISGSLSVNGYIQIGYADYIGTGGGNAKLNFAAGGSAGSPGATIASEAAGYVPLVVKGASSQTANLLEWQNGSGTVLAFVNSAGSIYSTSNVAADNAFWFYNSNLLLSHAAAVGGDTGNALKITANDGTTLRQLQGSSGYFAGTTTGAVVCTVKATSGQTANLAEFQNSSGGVRLSVALSGSTDAKVENPNGSVILKSGSQSIEVGQGGYAIYVTGGTFFNDALFDGFYGRWSITHDNNGEFLLGQSHIKWAATASFNGTIDVGLTRGSAGVVKVTDGSTGLGSLNVNTLDVNGMSIAQFAIRSATGTGLYLIGSQGGVQFGAYGVSECLLSANAANGSDVLVFTPTATTQPGLIARGLSSQTANLQEWQNSSGTPLVSISPAGYIFGAGSTAGLNFRMDAGGVISNHFYGSSLIARQSYNALSFARDVFLYWTNDSVYASGTVDAAFGRWASGVVASHDGSGSLRDMEARAYISPFVTVTYASTTTFDGSTGSRFIVTLTGSPTFAFSNMVEGVTYELLVKQDGSGLHTVTFPTVVWMTGATGAVQPATAAGAITVYNVQKVGSDYLMYLAGKSA